MINELTNSRLLTQELNMAQLDTVSAGAEEEEEPDEVLWEWLVMFLVYLLFTAFTALLILGIVELLDWAIGHEWIVVGAIAASGHPKEAWAYHKLSKDEKKRLWKEVYARIKR